MAYCTYCGEQISDSAVSCPKCGHPGPAAQAMASPYRRTEGLAVASLVLGLAGFAVCPIMVVTGIIAVVLGSRAKRRLAEDPSLDGHGMAKAGVILGWICIGLGIAEIALFIVSLVADVGVGVHIPRGNIDALWRIG